MSNADWENAVIDIVREIKRLMNKNFGLSLEPRHSELIQQFRAAGENFNQERVVKDILFTNIVAVIEKDKKAAEYAEKQGVDTMVERTIGSLIHSKLVVPDATKTVPQPDPPADEQAYRNPAADRPELFTPRHSERRGIRVNLYVVGVIAAVVICLLLAAWLGYKAYQHPGRAFVIAFVLLLVSGIAYLVRKDGFMQASRIAGLVALVVLVTSFGYFLFKYPSRYRHVIGGGEVTLVNHANTATKSDIRAAETRLSKDLGSVKESVGTLAAGQAEANVKLAELSRKLDSAAKPEAKRQGVKSRKGGRYPSGSIVFYDTSRRNQKPRTVVFK